jgi:ketosteroid isomerase-like protein
VVVPLTFLNLQGKKQIQLLFETINDKWESADVIPRAGTWVVKVPGQ